MLVFGSIVALMIFLLLRERQKFIFYIPVLLQLADVCKILIEGGPPAPISIMLDYSIVLTSVSLCLLIILGNVTYLKKYTFGVFILLLFFFAMIMFSSDIWWSMKRYMNIALAFLVFPAAFIIVKKIDDLKKIVFAAIWLIVIFLANVVLCTYFGLSIGESDSMYGRSIIQLGAVNFYSGYGFVYALIIIPLAYYLSEKTPTKYLLIILYFLGLFVLILIIKRTYIYLTVAGVLIFIFFITKRKNFRFIGPFFIIGFIGYILLSDYILASFAIRQDVIRRGYVEEGRGIELILYPQIVRASSNPTYFMLFGEELFNSQGKFPLIEKALNDRDRLLHSDVATILYGSGILGILLFIRFYYFIIKRYLYIRKMLKRISQDEIINKLSATFLSIYVCMIANTLSDGMNVAINRVFPYLMMGAILGVLVSSLNQPISYSSNSPNKNV